MEITQNNFDACLPDVLKSISTCDFMAFDCEFSGFGLGGLAILPFDTPLLVYDKAKANISNYTVMQFGLSTFRYDPAAQRFTYRAYNFYVFPRMPKSMGRLRRIVTDQFTYSSQADCMDFLASQNFDFNKWIVQGVGYLRETELKKLGDELKRQYVWQCKKATTAQNDVKIRENVAANVTSYMKIIQEFFDDSSKTEIFLDDINMLERRTLFSLLQKQYGPSLFTHAVSRDNGSTSILIRKCEDAEEHERMHKAKLEGDLKDVDNAAGFCKVISAICASNKPLLGHNLFLDLLHVVRAFICPLPETYEEFKELVQQKFKNLIDTKVLAGQPALKNVAGAGLSLADLQRKVTKEPFVSVGVIPSEPKYGYVLAKENLHEAGYDAFLTGFNFVHLANFMGEAKKPGRKTKDVPWDLMRPLLCKINPGRIIDLPYLSLTTPDLMPDRKHVFHLTFNSSDVTNADITELFSPYGPVYINWIDERSTFISLQKREQAEKVKKAMMNIEKTSNGAWKIRGAVEYLQELEQKLFSRLQQQQLPEEMELAQ